MVIWRVEFHLIAKAIYPSLHLRVPQRQPSTRWQVAIHPELRL